MNIEPGKHVCVIATAQVGQQNPIYIVHEVLFLVLVVERESGVIVDCDVNTVCDLTRQFIHSIFLGKNLITDIDSIRDCITENYMGASTKALITAAKMARGKLVDQLKKETK